MYKHNVQNRQKKRIAIMERLINIIYHLQYDKSLEKCNFCTFISKKEIVYLILIQSGNLEAHNFHF